MQKPTPDQIDKAHLLAEEKHRQLAAAARKLVRGHGVSDLIDVGKFAIIDAAAMVFADTTTDPGGYAYVVATNAMKAHVAGRRQERAAERRFGTTKLPQPGQITETPPWRIAVTRAIWNAMPGRVGRVMNYLSERRQKKGGRIEGEVVDHEIADEWGVSRNTIQRDRKAGESAMSWGVDYAEFMERSCADVVRFMQDHPDLYGRVDLDAVEEAQETMRTECPFGGREGSPIPPIDVGSTEPPHRSDQHI